MIRFFRSIRRGLIARNRFTNYLLYAVGEIILVVIGILIALQINNWNDARQTRALERKFLGNIRDDLVSNIAQIDIFLANRGANLEDAAFVIGQLEGDPPADVHEFNRRCVDIYEWQRFVQVNYTVQELISSGNLALLTNDRLKASLLKLESLYKAYKAEEDHARFDSEELLYKPIYAGLDLHPMLRAFGGEADVLDWAYFDAIRTNPKYKNGFLMATMEFVKMNGQLQEMKALCEDMVAMIDRQVPPMARIR